MSRIAVNKLANRTRTKEVNVDVVVDKLATKLLPSLGAPATRSDGSAIQVGDSYFDTAMGYWFTYKGSTPGWVSDDKVGVDATAGKASKGSNSDITSLSGLTTPLSVDQGGTGVNSAIALKSLFGIRTKNRIINGTFSQNQRAQATYSAGNTANIISFDRMRTINANAGGQIDIAGGAITYDGIVRPAFVARVSSLPTNLSGTSYWCPLRQSIEGCFSYDLKGRPVTVSFIANMSVAGTYSVALHDANFSFTCIKTFTVLANTPTKVVLVFPTLPANITINNDFAVGLTIDIGCVNNETFKTDTRDAWISGVFLASSTNTNWVAAVGNTISIAELQLEPGDIASPFEYRTFGEELALCQRYYRTGNASIGGYGVNSAAELYTQHFPAMRAVPTVSYTPTGPTNVVTFDVRNATINSVNIYVVPTSSTPAGYAVSFVWVVQSEL